MREWLSGGAPPCQGGGRGFDPRLALAKEQPAIYGRLFFCIRETGYRTCEEAVIRYSSLSGSLRLPLAGATCESYETGHRHAINIFWGIHEGFDPTGKIAVLHVMLEKMRNRLKTLEPRQQRVLMVHFGLNFMECKTISETAAYYHLTEKLILEIEKNALENLRAGMNDGKII